MPREPEIQMMNDRINSLEGTILRSAEASENVSKSVNDLLLEFKERDIRHEFERKANADLVEKVQKSTEFLYKYVETQAPVLARVKQSQDYWDSFYKSLSSNAGKIVLGIILLGTMVMLGLDPRTLFKG